MREGLVSDWARFSGRCFWFRAVASGAFDPEGASNLVWPHMAASAVSLAKGEFLIIPISCSIGPILPKGILARISAVLDRVVVRTMETDDFRSFFVGSHGYAFFFLNMVHTAMLPALKPPIDAFL